MKTNRLALLLLLLLGGLFASTVTSGSHQVVATPTATHTCQHATETTVTNTVETTVAPTQSSEPKQHFSERLLTALDAFAKLVMVM